MKDSLSDQVRKLERENVRLKEKLEKTEIVRVILKSHDGFVKAEEMRREDAEQFIILPARYREAVDFFGGRIKRELVCAERVFKLDAPMDSNCESDKRWVRTFIYREQ